jgi:HSP20 family molecular chaperone IbpA
VAERATSNVFDVLAAFERDMDTLFEDLLISRWRRTKTPVGEERRTAQRRLSRPPRTEVIERSDLYEVRMSEVATDRRHIDVEVSDRHLVVRTIGEAGSNERTVDFDHMVDPEGTSASLDKDRLIIILPKRPGRKIRLA